MSARDDILARIRQALQTPSPTPSEPTPAPTPTTPPSGDGRTADVVALFAMRVADYEATVHRCTAADAATVVADILRPLVGQRDVVLPTGLPSTVLDGLRASGLTLLLDDADAPLTPAALDAAAAVVTTSAVGIAETGTIVLDHGPGQGRRILTLLPDVHVCLVVADAVVADVPDAMAALDPRGVLTWISGPSATSDIELVRVEGVHGPRTLQVVVVQ